MTFNEQDISTVMQSTGMERMQAIYHLRGRETLRAAPMGSRTRISSDDAWPLRGADGRTFADRRPAPRPLASRAPIEGVPLSRRAKLATWIGGSIAAWAIVALVAMYPAILFLFAGAFAGAVIVSEINTNRHRIGDALARSFRLN